MLSTRTTVLYCWVVPNFIVGPTLYHIWETYPPTYLGNFPHSHTWQTYPSNTSGSLSL